MSIISAMPHFGGTPTSINTTPLSRKSEISRPMHDEVRFSASRKQESSLFMEEPWWLRTDGILCAVLPTYRDHVEMNSFLPPQAKVKRTRRGRPLTEPWRTISHHSLYAVSPEYRRHADLNAFLPPEVRKRGKGKITFNTLATGLSCAVLMFDQSAVASPAEIFVKYALRDTSSTNVNINALDLEGIEHAPGFPLAELQKLAEQMDGSKEKSQKVTIPFVYRMTGADRFSIGDLNAMLTGELFRKGDQWVLANGRVTAIPNFADYDPSNHREFLGEALTRAAHYIAFWGEGHWIVFDGAKDVYLSGKC